MLDALLRPHPDALALRPGRSGVRGGLQYFPLINLVWLFYVVASPWLTGDFSARFLFVTYGSVAVFLVLYYRAFYRERQRLIWNVLAIAALGLCLLPASASGGTYLIYSGALLPFCLPPRPAVRGLLLLVAAMVVESLLLADLNVIGLLSFVFACCAIFGLNLFTRYDMMRAAELRLSHEEIRRLAATAERERIGRDLHDLLGHTLSLIAIKSELARRLLDRDGGAARAGGDRARRPPVVDAGTQRRQRYARCGAGF